MNKLLLPCLAPLFAAALGCSGTTSFVKSDTTLGRVVVYRNGVAYFERFARVDGDTLSLSVPGDKVDDFLKSLTVVDARTGKPTPIAYPTSLPNYGQQVTDMKIRLSGPGPHELRLSYVTEAPSWKSSYRVILDKSGKVRLQAWAIVDNTSGEDWEAVNLGVGSSSALSFRYDLRSVRLVHRETLRSDDLFAQAPPAGESTYGRESQGKLVLADLSDDALAPTTPVDTKTEVLARDQRPIAANKTAETRATGKGRPSVSFRTFEGQTGGGSGASAAPQGGIENMARQLQATKKQVVVEGYADPKDTDKRAASLERANRAREQLIRNGVDPSQVVAIGAGDQPGRAGGVRILESPPPPPKEGEKKPDDVARPESTDPIGASHFESQTRMSVPRGSSAMVSILQTATEGEVVYLYDPESPRGNTAFPFKAVRLRNPTDSVLESGPVTVFGEGRFIGEGLCEPIPSRSVAFIPFALDRQIVVERKDAERDEISRVITVQRGVFSTEVQHTRKVTLALNNRLGERATVYVRHTVLPGYSLTKGPASKERIGAAHLFRVEVEPNAKTEVVIEEATPLFKSTDIRSTGGMELVKVYLSSAAAQGPLKAAVTELLKLQQEIGNLEQRIGTMREQMNEYRARMDELHAQLVTLKAVKTAGPLMQNLEKKLAEVSDRLSKATIDLVGVQEKLMVARIAFQDGVAELSLEKKPDTAPAAPKGQTVPS
jgi:hypothetical protein